MPSCPNCKTKVKNPEKIFSVPTDPNSQLVFVEHNIALYECPKCQLKFPIGIGKKKLKIVNEAEWEAVKKKAAEEENLRARVKALESELECLNEKLVLEGLRGRQERLNSEVALLREIKSDLSAEIRITQGIPIG